jgi:hypothetical protein
MDLLGLGPVMAGGDTIRLRDLFDTSAKSNLGVIISR